MLNWEDFVSKEGEKILNYVNKIIGQKDNSKDIVQDTFLAFYQNLDRIEDEYRLAWLYKTAHNKAINFLKKHKRLVLGNTPEQIHHDSIEDEIRQQKLEKAVRDCFRKLKPKYAMVLELQFYQKKSYKEISEITGMTVPAIESVLVRAKKECKKILKDLLEQNVI